MLRARYDGFDKTQVARALCLRGHSYEIGPTGRPLIIKRKDMKTLAQIWMTFILEHIVPIGHVSDLNMPRCYLLYSFLREDYLVNVARIISDEIYKFVNLEMNSNNERAKGSLGFPPLITTLCVAHGVEVDPTVKIRPTIDAWYIQYFYVNSEESLLAAQQPPSPHPVVKKQQFEHAEYSVAPPPNAVLFDQLSSIRVSLQHMRLEQSANRAYFILFIPQFLLATYFELEQSANRTYFEIFSCNKAQIIGA